MSLKTRPVGGGHLQPVIIAQRDELPSVPVETRSGESVDVYVQDQTTQPFDLYFVRLAGAQSTLAVQTAINDRSITVANDASFAVGGYMAMYTQPRVFFAEILAKPGGNVLNIDTPIDFEYTVGSPVQPLTRNMNVDGSVTPQVYFVTGIEGFFIDVVHLSFSMITDTACDLSTFGDLGELTNGFVFRKVTNINDIRNIWNVKRNFDFLNLCGPQNLEIFSSTNPAQGIDGLGAHYILAERGARGVVARLCQDCQLQLIISDDLSGLTEFRATASGHRVED